MISTTENEWPQRRFQVGIVLCAGAFLWVGASQFFFRFGQVGLRPVGFVDLWDEWDLVGDFLKLHQGLSSTAACQAPGGQCWFGQGAVGRVVGCPGLIRGGWGAICGCENLTHWARAMGQSCSLHMKLCCLKFWNRPFEILLILEYKEKPPRMIFFVEEHAWHNLSLFLCSYYYLPTVYSLFLIL